MNTLFAVAKNTFREAIRDRILLVILFFAALFLLAAPLAGKLSPGQGVRLVTDFGLAMLHIFGLFLTVFLGSRLVFHEIERKTIFLLLAKPLPRSHIIWGKFLGLSAVLLCTTALCSAVFFLLVTPTWSLVLIIGFIYLSLLLLLSIVLFFGTWMSPLLSSVASILFFLAGNISFSLRLFGENMSVAGKYMTEFLYYFLPNFSSLNLKNFVLSGIPYTALNLIWIALMAIIFLIIFLLAASAIFTRKEFEQ